MVRYFLVLTISGHHKEQEGRGRGVDQGLGYRDFEKLLIIAMLYTL
jgi:hypothetical protein